MGIEVLGIDLKTTVCSLAGLDAKGAVVYRTHLQRQRLLDFLEGLDPCIVAMKASGGAHHIGSFSIPQPSCVQVDGNLSTSSHAISNMPNTKCGREPA